MTQKGQWFTDLEALAKKEPLEGVVCESSCCSNKHNLSQDWFDRMRDNAPSEMHYDAEIRNIRPKKTTNGFYPSLDPKKHYYPYAYDNDYLQQIGVNAGLRDSTVRDTDYMKSPHCYH
jgi:hypothetical protein